MFLFLLVHPLIWKIKYSYSVFAYDHTIKANPIRGKSIKYFKTGLGVGKNLKRLETLIKENNHTDTVIEYLKVLSSILAISNNKFSL